MAHDHISRSSTKHPDDTHLLIILTVSSRGSARLMDTIRSGLHLGVVWNAQPDRVLVSFICFPSRKKQTKFSCTSTNSETIYRVSQVSWMRSKHRKCRGGKYWCHFLYYVCVACIAMLFLALTRALAKKSNCIVSSPKLPQSTPLYLSHAQLDALAPWPQKILPVPLL